MTEALTNKIMYEILRGKETHDFSQEYLEYSPEYFANFRIPKITVHGRFQPPLHINHFYTYIAIAFQIANKVNVLITNPDLDESKVEEATHRSAPDNNIFTYDERVEIFTSFFKNIGIPSERFKIEPFKITDKDRWYTRLDEDIPNLVNTYGKTDSDKNWSRKKLSTFQESGYKVIHSSFEKIFPVSGMSIRKILRKDLDENEKKDALIKGGLMPESIDKVLEVYNRRYAH